MGKVAQRNMDYIFSDPNQISKRIRKNYYVVGGITRLINQVKLEPSNRLAHDKVNNEWKINGESISLKRTFSFIPFFLRRKIHQLKLALLPREKEKFEKKIELIVKAFLQNDPNSLKSLSSEDSKEETDIEEEKKVEKENDPKVGEPLQKDIEEEQIIFTPAPIPDQPKVPIETKETKFIRELEALGFDSFYRDLEKKDKKLYRTICQPVPGGPLFAVAAELFILEMRKIQATLKRDPHNPYLYSIVAAPRKGTSYLKEAILTFDSFLVEIPRETKVEYFPDLHQWKLISGPKVIISTFIKDFTIKVNDISISSEKGGIKIQYELPPLFQSLQDKLDNVWISDKALIYACFKDETIIDWD